MLNARCGVSRYNAMQRNDKWGQCEAEHRSCGWRSGPINWGARAGVGACMIILRNMWLNSIIRKPKAYFTYFTHLYLPYTRPAQLAELPRSEFDPKLFPHSAYAKFFVTFTTKVTYLTFCNEIRQFFL